MRVVRHEVIMKIKADFIKKEAEVKQALEQICRYAKEIPEVRQVSTARSGDGITSMMVVVVQDEEALERYNEHPAHEQMVRLANTISEDFSVQDYIVQL